ncbi:CPBP family intramembrane metalloprotease [Bacteroides sp. 214]|uniref:CPBP family intramembrane glutamic endopeptidase n=1 Tax=Bacteroides sp. 214 TaxID=2302935 RepID=UPI0013D74CC0|nr:type II CAAX endopeptidase family protein [Bacteroides sp. 214]NDW13078.1 CPBP family intramembrane metalloprotease [Bacteroides sp. 214]
MGKSIGLVLLYYAFQILGGIIALILCAIPYLLSSSDLTGVMDNIQNESMPLTLLISILFMTIYLWRNKLISTEKVTWSPISFLYIAGTVVLYFTFLSLEDFMFQYLPEIPDFTKDALNAMQEGVLGASAIAFFGPVLEELLFRGAILTILLRKFTPWKAILISALIFGVFHLNPPQIISATLIGLILGWLYYKTASLIPCIIIHVLNNSLSVYLGINYPEVEYVRELVPEGTYTIIIVVALIAFVGVLWRMAKQPTTTFWAIKKEEIIEDNNNY